MKKIVFMVMLFAGLSMAGFAEAYVRSTKHDGALTVKEATTAEIENLFLQNDFQDYAVKRGKFPRIYMEHLPTDWKDVAENDAKHRTFIRILLPLVLKINEEIAHERKIVEELKDKYIKERKLSMTELSYLEETARKYDVFTRLKGKLRTQSLIRQLLVKIDAVPPSIMIATAAIYTDWGNSRLAMTANSLYLNEVWYQDEGIIPLDDPEGGYRYKAYDKLEDCIREKALALNSHVNYEYMREARRLSRQKNLPPYGEQLAAQMLSDSNLPNISGLIDYTFTFYKLNNTDFFPQLRHVK